MTVTDWHEWSTLPINHTAGWLISVLLHSSLIVSTLFFLQRIELAPNLKPFTWNVAIVASTSPSTATPSANSVNSGSSPVTPVTTATVQLPHPITTSPLQSETQRVKSIPQSVVPISPSTPVTADVTPPSPTPIQSEPESPVVSSLPEPSPTSLVSVTSPEPSSTIVTHATASLSEMPAEAVSSPSQVAALASPPNRTPRADYGWLSAAILRRVEELKRYPAEARVDHAEGKVVVKAVINEDGSIDDIEITQSSGHMSLDKAAADLMRRAAPFVLLHPLGKPRVTIKIPMSYRFER